MEKIEDYFVNRESERLYELVKNLMPIERETKLERVANLYLATIIFPERKQENER